MVRDAAYERSNIHREIFWLGSSLDGCPTLVVRTQAHDGADYDEDPRKFMAVLTHILETGRRQYGVGLSTQMCVILDRGPVEWVSGRRKSEMDMSVLPNLLNLFRHVYSTVMSHYPELLFQAKVVPTSWFFSMCYKITSVVMDSTSRSKFVMVRPEDVRREMSKLFPSEVLPTHLGGTARSYG